MGCSAAAPGAGDGDEPTATTESAVTVCGQTSVKGVDVSHYDGTIDWTTVKGAGISFAFVKATESTNFVDPMFATNWSGMKAAGVARGAYHFFHADVDPAVVYVSPSFLSDFSARVGVEAEAERAAAAARAAVEAAAAAAARAATTAGAAATAPAARAASERRAATQARARPGSTRRGARAAAAATSPPVDRAEASRARCRRWRSSRSWWRAAVGAADRATPLRS